MATLTFATGFEHGSLAQGGGGETLFASDRLLPQAASDGTVETSIVHHGTKALRNPVSYFRITQPAGTRRSVGSVYVYIVTLPSSNSTLLTVGSALGISSGFELQTNGTVVANCGNTSSTDGPTLTTGRWYRFEWYVTRVGNPTVMDWRIDGIDYAQLTYTQAANDITTIYLQFPAGSDVIYDCWVMSNTAADYPLGEYKVLGYAPNEDTDITQVGTGAFVDAAGTAISAGNPAYDNLDSRDFEQSSERVEQTANATTGFIEIGFEDSVESTAPIAVMAEGVFRADSTTTDDIEVRLRSGTNEDSWANGDPSEASNIKGFKCYATEPVSGAAWTTTLFNALRMRFGYSSDANPDPWVCALLLEAAFPVVTQARVPRQSTYPQLLPH